MADIVYMPELNGRPNCWTIKQALQDALQDVDDSASPVSNANKAFLIFLDAKDGKYRTNFSNVNMTASEIIALCDIMKHRMIKDMGY